ncbi:MAG TPA: sialidase family protein [Thermoleophilaceae bacterium]|nr:sialidase family protein [Thermoleophilaceae bacterium]
MTRRILVAALVGAALTAAPAHASAPLSWTFFGPISPGASPYEPGCAQSTSGTNYPGTEVEPWIATNPADPGNSIAVWQQDRYSNGGANSLRAAYSEDNAWTNPANQPAFTRCSGGTTAGVNDWERASDPWVAFSSDGSTAYFMALVFNQSASLENGMTVSRSIDGGVHWEATPKVLKYDANFHVLNDKNSLTADRSNPDRAYAIWDRLVFPNERSKGKSYENAGAFYGPTWFTRTTNGGDTWETARKIWDPAQERNDQGRNDQAIGNQIVQTGTGKLVDVFTWINNDNGGGNKEGGRKGYKIAALSSDDYGQTWSDHATVITHYIPGVVVDPTTGDPVRTGDIIPEIAYDPRGGSNTVYVIWQGASATSRSSIYLSESTDGGDTWSDPEIVNKEQGVEAFTPSIRVDKNGRVAITYYDFRHDTSSAPLDTDYWSIARDPGETDWAESHISGPFDQRTAAVARGFFLGDYAGLSTADNDDVFHAVFGQSTGAPPAHESDIEEADGD